MARQVATVGVIPIEKRCWRTLQIRVPALYLPFWMVGSQMLPCSLLRVLPAAGVTEQAGRQPWPAQAAYLKDVVLYHRNVDFGEDVGGCELSRNLKTARCGWKRMAASSRCEITLPRLFGRFGGLLDSRGLFSIRSGWAPKRDHQARSRAGLVCGATDE